VRGKAASLCVLALVLAGCGRTYSEAQVRRALVAAGTPIQENGPVFPDACPASASSFPPLAWAAQELMFDVPGVATPRALFEVRDGSVLVFCGTYDAWRAQQGLRFLREVRPRPRAFLTLLRARSIRRGNVLFVEIGRQPRLDAAAARLP
jgi:hypothetical protein